MPRYPDSERGAMDWLRDHSEFDLVGARARPDSVVKGVWAVKLEADPYVVMAIVYLPGYEDAMGRVREHGDLEAFERDEVEVPGEEYWTW